MITENIKDQFRNENLTIVNIQELTYQIITSENINLEINSLINFIKSNTNLKIEERRNEVEIIKYDKNKLEESITITNNKDSVSTNLLTELYMGDNALDPYLNVWKNFIIIKDKEDFNYMFELFITGEGSEYLKYEIEYLKDKEKTIKFNSPEANDVISDIAQEIKKNKILNEDIFEIINLKNDLETKKIESIFLPVFSINNDNDKIEEKISKERHKKQSKNNFNNIK